METKNNTSNINCRSSDYYEIDTISSKKIIKGKTLYLVKWKGYSAKESTWEPLSNLTSVQDLIENFENKRKKKKFKSSDESESESDSDNEINFNLKNEIELKTEKLEKSNSKDIQKIDKIEKVLEKKIDENKNKIHYRIKYQNDKKDYWISLGELFPGIEPFEKFELNQIKSKNIIKGQSQNKNKFEEEILNIENCRRDKLTGELIFLVSYKTLKSEMILKKELTGELLKLNYPSLLIQFYEDNIDIDED